MRRSLALSLLAALSGSTYATPANRPSTNKTGTEQSKVVEPSELTENQRIMLEVRKQVGSELNES